MMVARVRNIAWRRAVAVGLACYAAFVLTASFEHHDLSCELKTPQHCIACTSSLLSANPTQPTVPGEWQLVDAGSAAPADVVVDSLVLAVRSSGRSPPALL